jgi:hypothetical protein
MTNISNKLYKTSISGISKKSSKSGKTSSMINNLPPPSKPISLPLSNKNPNQNTAEAATPSNKANSTPGLKVKAHRPISN